MSFLCTWFASLSTNETLAEERQTQTGNVSRSFGRADGRNQQRAKAGGLFPNVVQWPVTTLTLAANEQHLMLPCARVSVPKYVCVRVHVM